MYAYGRNTCPKAKAASQRVISLPLHLNLEEGDIQSMANILKDAIKN